MQIGQLINFGSMGCQSCHLGHLLGHRHLYNLQTLPRSAQKLQWNLAQRVGNTATKGGNFAASLDVTLSMTLGLRYVSMTKPPKISSMSENDFMIYETLNIRKKEHTNILCVH